MTSKVGFMNSGKLRALAVTGKQRSPGVPNLPTVAEAGVPGYDVGAWFGVVVPKGTPRPKISPDTCASRSTSGRKSRRLPGCARTSDSRQDAR